MSNLSEIHRFHGPFSCAHFSVEYGNRGPNVHIVLVDDSRSALFALDIAVREIPGVHVIAFEDPAKALEHCLKSPIDLLIVDFTMPKYTGIELVAELKRQNVLQHVPVIMVTSETERSIRIQAIETGVTDFIGKPFDSIELKARVRNLLALRRAQRDLSQQASRLVDEVDKATEELAEREEEIIWRLARAIEFRDGDTGDHISRVAQISKLIAKDLGLSSEHCRMIYLAAPLHDVGKIGISDSVLLKPGRLTPDEITEMRRHVEIGVRILEKGTSDLVRIAEAVAGGHHEKWDGTGYPKGITGGNIPIEARIVAIADVFEALCSERPYKRAWPIEEARDHIIAQSGLHFDPACVTAFENQWSRIASLMAQDLPKTIVDVPSLETPDEPAGPNQTVSEKPAPIRETSNVK